MKFILLIMLIAQSIFSQSKGLKFNLPKGYVPYLNFDGKSNDFSGDLDGDNVKDKILVGTKKGDNQLFAFVYLTSNAKKGVVPSQVLYDWHPMGFEYKLKNKVISISSCFGNGRFCKTIRFRYDGEEKDLKVIGYDEESFGNAAHEGAYKSSYNLLTGDYEYTEYTFNEKKQDDEVKSTKKKKRKPTVITLSNLKENLKILESQD
ncbi:MAG: hypothetical protein SFU98_06640 [Leptospiraceae bacterium]|nr:hypothetical protein [Leptospiraceae bacterium]